MLLFISGVLLLGMNVHLLIAVLLGMYVHLHLVVGKVAGDDPGGARLRRHRPPAHRGAAPGGAARAPPHLGTL